MLFLKKKKQLKIYSSCAAFLIAVFETLLLYSDFKFFNDSKITKDQWKPKVSKVFWTGTENSPELAMISEHSTRASKNYSNTSEDFQALPEGCKYLY